MYLGRDSSQDYLGAEAYITAGQEQAQTWKSCVYSLLNGHVRVHQEEQAAEALMEMKSYQPYTKPCENILPFIHMQLRVLIYQIFATHIRYLEWVVSVHFNGDE